MKAAGRKTDALVEFVDVYPTLAERCGLAAPAGFEGTSLVPLLDDPARPWKRGAISQYPRSIPGRGKAMGYALRTERFRLVEWRVQGGAVAEQELYDLEKDPDENLNVAKRPEYAERLSELSALLAGGWKGLVPR
jgi:iduronate 2-sulfatase